MNKATRILVLTLVLYAALLTSLHGLSEYHQGASPTNGISIHAIGAPCEPDLVWHACFPALTIFGTYDTAGLMTLILTGLLIARSIRPMKKARQGLLLILLGGLLFISGGGFIAFFIVLVAGTAAFFKPKGKQGEISPFSQKMANGWPWLLVIYLLIVGLEALLGAFNNELASQLSGILLPIEFTILILAAVAAHAWDLIQNESKP
ncbi:hypothetical protein JR338_12995 (plasmid) [Chloroflexota bacterium]|nr:hypothetical protein JR338_12995 [Chloroflexota bacterium]